MSYLMKNLLTIPTASGGPGWHLVSCSDSIRVDYTGSDILDSGSFDASKWVAVVSPTAHTWYVLKSEELGMSMCVDLNNADSRYIQTLSFVSGNFDSAGLITVRPSSSIYTSWFYTALAAATTDGTANKNSISMVCSTGGDVYMWGYKVGSGYYEDFGFIITRLGDLDPILSDMYPVVTYYSYSAPNVTIGEGGFGATRIFAGNSTWKGQTAGGVMCDGTTPSTRVLSMLFGSGRSYAGSLGTLLYWPSGGGGWRHTYPSYKLPLCIDDEVSPAIHTDYKGTLVDVEGGTRIGPGTGVPNASPPTRRNIGCLWLPGMPLTGPLA
jgi:hypothetical protein